MSQNLQALNITTKLTELFKSSNELTPATKKQQLQSPLTKKLTNSSGKNDRYIS